ncbi:hypothetical protein Y1Q_0019457 [Alligator mississippiensis]|uniref:Uncharacterized protein n=1 Tax=Alligator mississippiensis TaxID=8496 RepID=A0A151NMT8_ALLMI|nr:hypothetical protein Y1Q_0019457 [Alligator mississippiensis]
MPGSRLCGRGGCCLASPLAGSFRLLGWKPVLGLSVTHSSLILFLDLDAALSIHNRSPRQHTSVGEDTCSCLPLIDILVTDPGQGA